MTKNWKFWFKQQKFIFPGLETGVSNVGFNLSLSSLLLYVIHIDVWSHDLYFVCVWRTGWLMSLPTMTSHRTRISPSRSYLNLSFMRKFLLITSHWGSQHLNLGKQKDSSYSIHCESYFLFLKSLYKMYSKSNKIHLSNNLYFQIYT